MTRKDTKTFALIYLDSMTSLNNIIFLLSVIALQCYVSAVQ